jgi:DNA-binding beta-propeller fold protein YncE
MFGQENRLRAARTAPNARKEWARNVVSRTLQLVVLFSGLAAYPADSIYVSLSASVGFGEIRRFTPSGSATPFKTGLTFPTGLAFDGAGNLFVATYSENTIRKLTPSGVMSVFATVGVQDPHGLAFDGSGNLYVASEPGYIEKFTPGGVGSVFASGLGSPANLAFDKAGNLYVADLESADILRIAPDGQDSIFAHTRLNFPTGLAFDAAGSLYVCSGTDGIIEKFSPGGTDLGAFARNGMASPYGMAFDSAGNLYVANSNAGYGYGWIEKYTPGGVGSVFASGLPLPTCLAIVPEPPSWALSAFCLLGLAARGARRGSKRPSQ